MINQPLPTQTSTDTGSTLNLLNKLETEILETYITHCQVISEDFVKYNSRNRLSNVISEKVANKLLWVDILEKASTNLESIIFKYWAVEQVEKGRGEKTPGMDGLSFKSPVGPSFKTNEVEKAKNYLANL